MLEYSRTAKCAFAQLLVAVDGFADDAHCQHHSAVLALPESPGMLT